MISRWMPASTSFASARVRPKSAMSTRPSGRLISTTSAHRPSPSAPISTSLKTQATHPPSVRERRGNTRPPSYPQSRDGPLSERLASRVQISSDALAAYVDAVERAFGADVDYGQEVKFYAPEA